MYFPPFKVAVDAGVGTLISAFNSPSGTPASGNRFTLTTVLGDEWKFDGFVVSDWASVHEMIDHGVVADDVEAAQFALTAGKATGSLVVDVGGVGWQRRHNGERIAQVRLPNSVR